VFRETQLEHVSVTTNYINDTFCEKGIMHCWKVTSTGVISGRWLADKGTTIGSVWGLKLFFEYDDFVVGDLSTNELLQSTTPVVQDMNVVVNKKSIEIIIDFEDGVEQVSSSEMAKMISEATGIATEKLIFVVQRNERGEILHVILYVDNDTDAKTILDMINNRC